MIKVAFDAAFQPDVITFFETFSENVCVIRRYSTSGTSNVFSQMPVLRFAWGSVNRREFGLIELRLFLLDSIAVFFQKVLVSIPHTGYSSFFYITARADVSFVSSWSTQSQRVETRGTFVVAQPGLHTDLCEFRG